MMSRWRVKRKHLLLFTILIYSLIFFIVSPLYMGLDDSFYCDLAESLHENHQYTFISKVDHRFEVIYSNNPPGLPYMLAFFMFFFSEEMSIKVVIFLSLLLLLYGMYFLGKEIHGEKCGYLSVLFTMTMPLIPMYFYGF